MSREKERQMLDGIALRHEPDSILKEAKISTGAGGIEVGVP